MVLLIGGSSHVGKTLLAQRLMEKYHIPYMSLDHLKMGFIRSGLTELTVFDDYKMRYFMWPFVAEIIKTVVENGQNLILEGCYIPSEWRESFTEDYLRNIRSVFIVMSEEYLRANFASVADMASVIERRVDDKPDLERLIACSREFKEECIEYDIPYIEIAGRYDISELTGKAAEILELQETENNG